MRTQDVVLTSEIPKPRKSGRGYTLNIPIEKLLELKKKDLTDEQVATIIGCERSNVTKRLAKYKDTINNLERFKNHRADVLAFNQSRLLNSITDAEIKKAPLGTKVLAACQLYDKERLERGQSTENVSIKSITEHYSTELSKAQEALKALVDDP